MRITGFDRLFFPLEKATVQEIEDYSSPQISPTRWSIANLQMLIRKTKSKHLETIHVGALFRKRTLVVSETACLFSS